MVANCPILGTEADRKTFLFNQCLAYSSNFDEDAPFSFYVKIDGFEFSVKHRRLTHNLKKTKVKYVSPSTRRRNNFRLLAFKAKKAAKRGKGPTRSGPPPPLTRKLRVGRET